jgi:hypothetical protein
LLSVYCISCCCCIKSDKFVSDWYLGSCILSSAGIDINGSLIARDKWKPSSDKWNLIHTCLIGQVIISVRYVRSLPEVTPEIIFSFSIRNFSICLKPSLFIVKVCLVH